MTEVTKLIVRPQIASISLVTEADIGGLISTGAPHKSPHSLAQATSAYYVIRGARRWTRSVQSAARARDQCRHGRSRTSRCRISSMFEQRPPRPVQNLGEFLFCQPCEFSSPLHIPAQGRYFVIDHTIAEILYLTVKVLIVYLTSD
jgi:hypothetical protein